VVNVRLTSIRRLSAKVSLPRRWDGPALAAASGGGERDNSRRGGDADFSDLYTMVVLTSE
jgi:hypothetical protein